MAYAGQGWGRTMGLIAAVLLALTSAGWAGDPSAVFPENTLVVISVPDVPRLLQRWETSGLKRFYEDPRAAGFFAPLRKRVDGLRRRTLERYGITPGQAREFLNGGLALGLWAKPGAKAGQVEWVLVFEHAASPAVMKALRRPPRVAGTQVETAKPKVAGRMTTVTRLIREEAARIPAGSGLGGIEGVEAAPPLDVKRRVAESYQSYLDDRWAVYAGPEGQPIERVLPRLDLGNALAPDQDDLWQGCVRFSGEAWAQAAGQWLLPGKDEAGKLPPLSPEILCLQDIQEATLRFGFGADRMQARLELVAPGQRRGLVKGLFLEGSLPPDLARLVPADTVRYSASGIRPAQAWAALWEIVGQMPEEARTMLRWPLDALRQGSGIDVDADLIGHLGQGFVRWESAGEERPTPLAGETWMLGLADGAAFGRALEGALQYVSRTYSLFRIEKGQIGHWPLLTIYAGRPDAQFSGAPLGYLCVTDRWLVASRRRGGIDQVVARLDDGSSGSAATRPASLAEKDEYLRVACQLPEERVWEGFADVGRWHRQIDGLWFASRRMPLDRSAMPAPEVWAGYFGSSGGARTVQPDRVRIDLFVLNP